MPLAPKRIKTFTEFQSAWDNNTNQYGYHGSKPHDRKGLVGALLSSKSVGASSSPCAHVITRSL